MRRLTRWLFTRTWFQSRLRAHLQRLMRPAYPLSDLDFYWRGGTALEPTFRSRCLLRLFGWEVELHELAGSDVAGEFHSHPYRAYRFILSGGYIEQVLPVGAAYQQLEQARVSSAIPYERVWWEGDYGPVNTNYVHRIGELLEPLSFEPPMKVPTCDEQDDLSDEELYQLGCDLHEAFVAGELTPEPAKPVYTLWIHSARTTKTELYVLSDNANLS